MDGALILLLIVVIIILFGLVLSRKVDNGPDRYNDNNDYSSRNTESVFPKPLSITELKGLEGEEIVQNCLNNLLKEDEYLLTNLLLPLKNGYETEIDCVLITRKGIFCIEVKNWVGSIIADDESNYWRQEYNDPNMVDKEHRNPVKQNDRHCCILEEKLNREYKVHNAVIFPVIEEESCIDSNYVYDIDDFINYYNKQEEILSSEEIDDIYKLLKCYKASEEELQDYKEKMKKRYHN